MLSLTAAASLLAPLLAGLFLWTGLPKVAGRGLRLRVARTALPRLMRGPGRATFLMRATGVAELALAAALLTFPATMVPGLAAAALGAGFLGYLSYARAVAPESSCGCTASDDAPVTWHSFARAGLVAAGGAGAAAAGEPWWRAAADRPFAAAAVLAAGALLLGWLSAAPERRWQLPLRRLRLRLSGHPLGGDADAVPVAASVELLERSLAWETAVPLIRSGLVEHWDEDGWRILHYTGAHGKRPLSVLFALDAGVHRDRPAGRVIRVSVVDRETAEVVTEEVLDRPRPRLPLAG